MKVAIIMGSNSDWRVMEAAAQCLDEFGVTYDKEVVSAHRTPDKMFQFSKEADPKYDVIIAGAGGAAHLPGMVASISTVPVIGVPVSVGSLKGQDSLLSIVQMPKGIPVATVAIDNAWNAGLLAVQILSIKYEKLIPKVYEYRKALSVKVEQMKLD